MSNGVNINSQKRINVLEGKKKTDEVFTYVRLWSRCERMPVLLHVCFWHCCSVCLAYCLLFLRVHLLRGMVCYSLFVGWIDWIRNSYLTQVVFLSWEFSTGIQTTHFYWFVCFSLCIETQRKLVWREKRTKQVVSENRIKAFGPKEEKTEALLGSWWLSQTVWLLLGSIIDFKNEIQRQRTTQ